MTDEEWVKGIKDISNKELIRELEYCGHDAYYNHIYYPILKEIKRRLRGGKRNNKQEIKKVSPLDGVEPKEIPTKLHTFKYRKYPER